MSSVLWSILFVGGALFLIYRRTSLRAFTVAYGIALLVFTWLADASLASFIVLWPLLAILVLLNVDSLRTQCISSPKDETQTEKSISRATAVTA